MRVKASRTAGRFEVTDDAQGIEPRAGMSLPAQVANHTGLTAALSQALGGVRSWRDHDPGKVVRDLAVMLIDGGECVSDEAPYDPELFDQQAGVGAASQPTAWRTLEAVADHETALLDLAEGLAGVRGHVWSLPGGVPPALTGASGEPVCIDVDATLVSAHSLKDGAAGTYKHTFGFHPDLAFLDRGDGTGEALAGLLRPGNAASNDAIDHCDLLDAALAALPVVPAHARLVVRGDSAYATKEFVAHVGEVGCWFSVSYPVSAPVADAVRALDESAWAPAARQDGEVRAGAAVAEVTDHVTLPRGWPADTRVLVRREPLLPGTQQSLDDLDGYRVTAVLTDQPDADITAVERRHRARARAEDRIAGLKTLGLGNLPCADFDRNAVWLHLSLLALNLLVWTQALTLDGELAQATPKRLRYQLFHVPARVVHTSRRTIMRLPADWPWTRVLLDAFARLRTLPAPT